LSRCSALEVVYRRQQAVQAVVAERDTDGRPLLWLVVADLQLEPLEQGAQQRFGRRSQPFWREQGKQIQQVDRLLIGLRPFGDHGSQLRQFGLLLAVQFSQPPSDLLEQRTARVVALLERANQAHLAALEVGKGSLERLHPRLPRRDLATGDVGEILGEQGTPFGTKHSQREELQHAAHTTNDANNKCGWRCTTNGEGSLM
jgi:hypothetical protein